MHSSSCQRSHVLAALAVDGELSEVEARALARHLERCATCRTYARRVESFTRDLRGTELESFRVESLPLRRGRDGGGILRGSIAAAAIASIATVGFVSSMTTTFAPKQASPQAAPVLVIDATAPESARETQLFLHELRDVSLARTVGGPPPVVRNRPGPIAG